MARETSRTFLLYCFKLLALIPFRHAEKQHQGAGLRIDKRLTNVS